VSIASKEFSAGNRRRAAAQNSCVHWSLLGLNIGQRPLGFMSPHAVTTSISMNAGCIKGQQSSVPSGEIGNIHTVNIDAWNVIPLRPIR